MSLSTYFFGALLAYIVIDTIISYEGASDENDSQ